MSMRFYVALPISTNDIRLVRKGCVYLPAAFLTIISHHLNLIVGVVNNFDFNAVSAISNSYPGEEQGGK